MFITLTNAQYGRLDFKVDPARIAAIENRGSYRVIYLLGSQAVTVTETTAEIEAAIAAATTPAPTT